MPYSSERAPRLGHVATARNAAVAAAMKQWVVTSGKPTSAQTVRSLCRPLDQLPLAGQVDAVDFSITVDGSDTEVETTRDHPTVKVGYLRVAGSMVRLDRFRELAKLRHIDPRVVRAAHGDYAFDVALPGAQLARPGMSGVDTWRAELNEFLTTARFDSSTQMTLADGLLALHGPRGKPATELMLRVCPDCGYRPKPGQPELAVGRAGGICSECSGPLYLADVLRTHEEYSVEGSNLSPIGRVMTAAERLMTTCYLEYFAASAPDVLTHTLFLTDGPLALFGPLAPLKRRFQEYLGDLSAWCETKGIAGPLVVGMEKSGAFVEHAAMISELIEPGHVMRLPNHYINVITGRSPHNEYGHDEFYGRRFIYRTSTGDPLVVTVPPKAGVAAYDGSDDAEEFDSYPTLRLICEVLDSLRTRMYANAVIPVALAHSAAALPLGVGRSVLTMMAQQNIQGLRIDRQAVQPVNYPDW